MSVKVFKRMCGFKSKIGQTTLNTVAQNDPEYVAFASNFQQCWKPEM